MESNYRRRRGFFRHRYRRDRNRDRKQFDHQQSNDRQYPECPICRKPVREISSAIAYQSTNEPAHIECVINEISKTETLEQNERICYLGKGTFGIITARNTSSPLKFLIKKRIQYENSNAPVDWRKRIP
jgi:hypothetical protein